MIDINKIIPPADRDHREGFSNEHLVNELTSEEKLELEDILIQMLSARKEVDTLITETLAYLKSEKAIPEMIQASTRCDSEICRLSVYSSIFVINEDSSLVELAVSCFKKIEKKILFRNYLLIDAFYYLSIYNTAKTSKLIEPYINHKDFLVSYNAKRSLGLIKD